MSAQPYHSEDLSMCVSLSHWGLHSLPVAPGAPNFGRRGISWNRVGEAIIADVARIHSLTVADIKGPSQTRPIVMARQESMARCYATDRWSTPTIGAALGGRHHTTVLSGIRQHAMRGAR